ncbi:MAG: hypothetical protein HUU01_20625 [Saprospiraceae bacterium]|nr:hypothetical protein [Saprospiraceae bacterium]
MTAKKGKIEIKKPPMLFEKTQALIADIQNELDGDLLVYWISDDGSLVEDDVVNFYQLITARVCKRKLYLFIKSYGGYGNGALRIIHLLRSYYEEIVALVPLDCASAATMLALGADLIKMGPLAYLSAIDTSITHELSPIDQKLNNKVSVSQNELDRVLKLWDMKQGKGNENPYGELYKYIHPLVFGAVDRASLLSIRLTTEILSYHMKDEEKARKISNHLNADYPSHSYPITLREARRIGLNVEALDEALNSKLLQLNNYYSEMAQHAHTDYDEANYHDNEILKVMEMVGEQRFYQKDKDWHYLADERRYIPMNDASSWRKLELQDNKITSTNFYIS